LKHKIENCSKLMPCAGTIYKARFACNTTVNLLTNVADELAGLLIQANGRVLGCWGTLLVEPWLENLRRTQIRLCGSLSNICAILNQIVQREMKPAGQTRPVD